MPHARPVVSTSCFCPRSRPAAGVIPSCPAKAWGFGGDACRPGSFHQPERLLASRGELWSRPLLVRAQGSSWAYWWPHF
ncbi:hypothetical protein L916_05812 [Phytophthora nicotianae]|uniref:Uncharacterized protein n=1 Tax=Phytophthora nicotianae TaxID=4792 RepID=W2JBH3_PHYNI|nr:hypothetical protein L916_05812 [Phytophthora nicotianae]